MKNENNIIAQKIFSLDSSGPQVSWEESDLWDHIEKQKNSKRKTSRIIYAAACVSILISLALIIYYSNPTTFTIEHTTEISELQSLQPNDLHDLEASTLEFIETSCKTDIDVCESAEFKALTRELNALELEMASLEGMIATYGDDPSFVKSKIQIENLKSEIIGKLVQMILS